ncbi:MAG: NnrS family protein [Burkholderiales bacterium]|nr:NnrS family protein [Burkholderiales bacterium]
MTPGRPSAEVLAALDRHWRARYLLLAPHRLGFFLAMVVLVASGIWWALVQLDRVSVTVALPYALSPTLVHAAVMTFGFTPLFFSGFLFTAAPKWLRVEPIAAPLLLMPLLMQACGWLLWVGGIHVHMFMALAGLALAWSGLARITWLFWRLVWRSQESDRLHARTVGVACLVGCVSLGGLLANLVVGATAMALACVLTGLWGFVVVVFVTVAHRMIPFFTSSAMPFINAWRPFWVLGLMLGAAVVEGVAVWVEIDGPLHGPMAPVWMLARGIFELAAGGILLWLAQVWGVMQSLKNRLLAMLHIGFLWLGLALALGGAAQILGLLQDAPVLSLGSLHALTMGCLTSLMLAMVTRVSYGHSGRAQVADRIAWTLFWLVQLATLLRITASAQSGWASWLLLPTALLWAGTMAVWGVRLGNWYGRLRPDGRAG